MVWWFQRHRSSIANLPTGRINKTIGKSQGLTLAKLESAVSCND